MPGVINAAGLSKSFRRSASFTPPGIILRPPDVILGLEPRIHIAAAVEQDEAEIAGLTKS
jgi:hypothetical protein